MIIVLQLRLVTKENKANIPAMVAWYILLLPWNDGNNLLRKSKLKLIAPNNNTSQRYLNNTTQQLHWKNQLALHLHNKTNVTNSFLLFFSLMFMNYSDDGCLISVLTAVFRSRKEEEASRDEWWFTKTTRISGMLIQTYSQCNNYNKSQEIE